MSNLSKNIKTFVSSNQRTNVSLDKVKVTDVGDEKKKFPIKDWSLVTDDEGDEPQKSSAQDVEKKELKDDPPVPGPGTLYATEGSLIQIGKQQDSVPKTAKEFMKELTSSKRILGRAESKGKMKGKKKAQTGLSRFVWEVGQHQTQFLKIAYTGTTNGSGVLSAASTLDPSGCTDWSSFATLFDEFRVVAVRFQVFPSARYLTTSIGLVATAFDNDSTATGTVDQVLQYGTSRGFIVQDDHVFSWRRPNITPSAYWVDCASPSSSAGAILVSVTGAPSSVTLLFGITTYEIEFRSRR